MQVALVSEQCDWCPRKCGANRAAGARGICGADDKILVARSALHYWEEPPISGTAGSGTIFFSHCPMHCIYCQNVTIASGLSGKEISLERLVELCLEQRDRGALNINFVTPTHYTYQIIEAVRRARTLGLNLPIVWNTSGYETVETVRALKDTVDVWLTDFKYADSQTAQNYSHAHDYPQVALAAIAEMLKAVQGKGGSSFDTFEGQNRMTRGIIVRHLILPGHVQESCMVLQLLWNNFGNDIKLSIMNQYTPVLDPSNAAALTYPNLLNKVTNSEYEEVLEFADDLGFVDYFWQDGAASDESFIPAFDNTGV